MPGEPGLAICRPYSFSRVRSTSSSSTSMTTSGRALSIAVMIRPAAATRSGVSLMVMALVAAIGARRRASTTMRSTSIVSLRSALLRKNVRTTSSSYSRRLAGGVGNDGHRARRGRRARSSACSTASEVSASVDRRFPQVDADRLIAERRVEDDAQVRELADGREDVAGAGVAEDQRVGQRDVGRHVGAGQRRGEAVLDQRFERRAAFRDRSPPWCAAARAACAARPGCRRWPGSARRRAGTRSSASSVWPVARCGGPG